MSLEVGPRTNDMPRCDELSTRTDRILMCYRVTFNDVCLNLEMSGSHHFLYDTLIR